MISKRERKPALEFSNFGFSTILLAFIMICIATIAALSLLTANSDYKLSQKVAEKNTTFYNAEHQAYEILSGIDSALALTYQNATGSDNYFKEAEQTLSQMDFGTYDRTTRTYTYRVPIAENQTLVIAIAIQYPTDKSENFYKVITWKSEYDEVEIDEGTLDLID